MNHDEAKRAVVTAGAGRGFVVQAEGERLVVTAAHCLPHLRPAAADSENRGLPRVGGNSNRLVGGR
jgi:hypothetical protein